jgi:mono/diheme cytochrome c family protein
MRGAAALLLAALALLAGCDDMIHQAKRNAYRDERTGPGAVPDGTVRYAERPSAPPPLTLALIQHGQERFRQWCVPCHSELGNGEGMVVKRGFSPPPSYHIARLRAAPTAHFYDVITNGYGAMYSFAERVPPADRWAIAAYIRALQRSTAGQLRELDPADQRALAQEASR